MGPASTLLAIEHAARAAGYAVTISSRANLEAAHRGWRAGRADAGAVFAGNDQMALGAMPAFHEAACEAPQPGLNEI